MTSIIKVMMNLTIVPLNHSIIVLILASLVSRDAVITFTSFFNCIIRVWGIYQLTLNDLVILGTVSINIYIYICMYVLSWKNTRKWYGSWDSWEVVAENMLQVLSRCGDSDCELSIVRRWDTLNLFENEVFMIRYACILWAISIIHEMLIWAVNWC